MMMRKLFIEMMGNGDGEMMMRSERRRRRRERDEEPGGAARGAVGPGRSSWRRRGVAVPALREDCVEDCGVVAVVRQAYVQFGGVTVGPSPLPRYESKTTP